MSSTKPAAEEASTNPADAVAPMETSVQGSAQSAPEDKSAVAGTIADSTTKNAPAAKPEESSATSNGKVADKKENGDADKKRERGSDRKDDRYSKYGRGDARKGSYKDNYRTKSKISRNNEFENLPETDDPFEIRAQVEFYFSVQNLSTDKHLFLEVRGAENRPVPIKHITSFKRMRRFQPYSAVVAALRDSEDLIVVDDGKFSGIGNEAIQRKEPLSVPKKDSDDKYKPDLEDLYLRMFSASQNRLDASIYVKGFGTEEDAGQIAIEQFFKPYGSIMVRKRRDEDDNWKGSVFVEFDSEDSQEQFLALDPKPKFNGNELTIMGKKAYSEMKCKEKGIIPAWQQVPGAGEGPRTYRERDNRGGRGRGRGRGRGGHDGRGRGYDRRNNDRRQNRRDRSRSHSPHEGPRYRRERSGSRDSRDSRDWNGRRDKFQKSRDFGHDKRDGSDKYDRPHFKKEDDKNNTGVYVSESIIRDADGVPIVQDTRDAASKATKRKAEDDTSNTTKKSKIEIKLDA
ncbi:hypothetical protein K505DRAFT_306585 [Melanomma pulvis-pyrius CBS 109.77]|uniref:RRM domain-containing protein n=1 Tax=Melanomma pulvis-pyrius CBS 109.77 TaxID=1314802 RepID=A0A6A6XAG4_9PLEO|nr:hypothetical protein K505DRAFT_306585 [Melanomma pulvis-pyrius CBS 109.77]